MTRLLLVAAVLVVVLACAGAAAGANRTHAQETGYVYALLFVPVCVQSVRHEAVKLGIMVYKAGDL